MNPFFCLGRAMGVALVVMTLLAGATGRAAEPDMRLSSKKVRDEVRAVVEAQLAALRARDFAAAYDFAARAIRRQFDERVFALMIQRGYTPLLRSARTDLGVVRDDGEGVAQVSVTVFDAQNRSTVYRYWLVLEGEAWRISGVVLEQRPPRGDT